MKIASSIHLLYLAYFCSASYPSGTRSSSRSTQVSSSQSQYNQPLSEPEYSWDHNYHNAIPTSPQSSGHPTLIVQALGQGPLEELLSITSRVNRAYAKRWGFDYLSFVSNKKDGIDGDGYWQSCPYLLQSLLKRMYGDGNGNGNDFSNNSTSTAASISKDMVVYDTVMFLEANAVVVQLDFNILSLIQKDSILASGAVISTDGDYDEDWSIGSIYSDVMLWNLKHPSIQNVTASWLEAEMNAKFNSNADSDTNNNGISVDDHANANADTYGYGPAIRMLDAMKQNVDDSNVIQEIPRDMVNGLKGTLIKQGRKFDIDGGANNNNGNGIGGHGINHGGHNNGNGNNNNNNGNGGRIEESDLYKIVPILQGISDNVCYRYYPQCEIV